MDSASESLMKVVSIQAGSVHEDCSRLKQAALENTVVTLRRLTSEVLL